VCRRRSSTILGERLNLPYHPPAVNETSSRNNSSASASTSEWTRGEEEASSILANLNGKRSRHNAGEHATATTVSSAVSARLFTAYFANIHPIWPILYMPMHDYMNNNLRSDAFAPAVLYAVYSIAACLESAGTPSPTAPEDKVPPSPVFFEGMVLRFRL
jgi:hypothetical protein